MIEEVDGLLPFELPTVRVVEETPPLSRVHFASGRQDWRTPKALFDALNKEFLFTADLAASEDNHLLPTWLGPGHVVPGYQDALTCQWHLVTGYGGVGFCNPPYRLCADFLARAHVEMDCGVSSVFLIPARTDTRYWHDHVAYADEVRFLKGRLTFEGAAQGAPFPSCVVVFRGKRAGCAGPVGPRMVCWDWRG